MRFRPCIDLHGGVVKQIVGGTLTDNAAPDTNFQADKPAEWFADLYRRDGLRGGHIIQLGPGNAAAARAALAAWPGGMQIGGGISADNAAAWLDAGASHVIVTSFVFHDGVVDMDRLKRLVTAVGRDRLVLDLSCRRTSGGYVVVTDRWQTFTRERVDDALMDALAAHCAEFLIHAVDVEGKCRGIETDLMTLLGRWTGIPVTYAGGIRSMADIAAIDTLSRGRIDFTVGSALDIFGGAGLSYREVADLFGGADA
ncbi:MAG: phosphoribosylformimino-5-aminoimidazole carboxamide ribotide isomerase [Pseudomonadota bacterium]